MERDWAVASQQYLSADDNVLVTTLTLGGLTASVVDFVPPSLDVFVRRVQVLLHLTEETDWQTDAQSDTLLWSTVA